MNVTLLDFALSTLDSAESETDDLRPHTKRDSFHDYFDENLWTPIFGVDVLCLCFIIFTVGIILYQLRCQTLRVGWIACSVLSLIFFFAASIFFSLYTIHAKFSFGRLNTTTLS